MRVGIARALLFYRYYPLWKTFFEELDMEVVVSPETTKSILEVGLKRAVDEICLPVKTFHGHIDYLIDKVDYIFLPRIVSIEPKRYKRFTCPKFIGLPDMIKGAFEELPKVLEVEIDLMKEPLSRSYQRLGNKLVGSRAVVSKALNKALKVQDTYEQLILKGNPPEEAMKAVFARDFYAVIARDEVPKQSPWHNNQTNSTTQQLTIAVVGHPYILFDHYISADILSKLRALGAKIITSYSFPHSLIEAEMSKYKEVSWSYEREIIGCISYCLGRDTVPTIDGIIYLISFGCGPGSIVREIVMREVERYDLKKQSRVPFLTLIMDEHTGESGILTRIEAFIDMIKLLRARGTP